MAKSANSTEFAQKLKSTAGRSESTPADCLPKTQLPANSQEDV
jgi:hypothetical protein